jgi:hypothetical protein
MSRMKESKRDELPKSDFGLPSERKYPMPDASHAADAKARATQQEKKGTITAAQRSQIDKKANQKLEKDK